MKKENKFYVLWWSYYSNKLEKLEILSYLKGFIDDRKTKPKTKEELKKEVLSVSLYHFWGKCEWEIIISDWPKGKEEEKIDVYYQIEMNIDVIVDLLWENLKKK